VQQWVHRSTGGPKTCDITHASPWEVREEVRLLMRPLLTAANSCVKIHVFWDVTLFHLLNSYWRFWASCYILIYCTSN